MVIRNLKRYHNFHVTMRRSRSRHRDERSTNWMVRPCHVFRACSSKVVERLSEYHAG